MCMTNFMFTRLEEDVVGYRVHIVFEPSLFEISLFSSMWSHISCNEMQTKICTKDNNGKDFYDKISQAGWHVLLKKSSAVLMAAETIMANLPISASSSRKLLFRNLNEHAIELGLNWLIIPNDEIDELCMSSQDVLQRITDIFVNNDYIFTIKKFMRRFDDLKFPYEDLWPFNNYFMIKSGSTAHHIVIRSVKIKKGTLVCMGTNSIGTFAPGAPVLRTTTMSFLDEDDLLSFAISD